MRQLDQRYPRLAEESASSALITTLRASDQQLDIGAVLAASQAVSVEIFLEQLIETLMTLALEYTHGNHRDASRLLGISRQTMRVKLRALGLHVAHSVEPDDDDQQ